MTVVTPIVTDIECPCGFIVIIDQPDRQIGIARQIRREWFRHQREEHPDVYERVSPNFLVARAERAEAALERKLRNAEKHRLAEKKAARRG